jgi:hypothetical protein
MIKKAKISDLKFDDKNANVHTEKGMRILEKSLSKLGAGRSVLLDIGLEDVILVETKGNEIVAVKRTDIDINSKKGRELAIADNHVAKESINLNKQVLRDLQAEYECDFNFYEVNTESTFGEFLQFAPEEYEENKLPYPITIVVNKDDYERWCAIKEKLNINNDKKAFFEIIGSVIND